MIEDALTYIKDEIVADTGVAAGDVHIGDVQVLKESKKGVFLSLVNLSEEGTLKNGPHYYMKNGRPRYKEPPVYLNLFLLVAFHFDQYTTGITRLSETIELFQSKPWFGAENQRPGNSFPANLERLVFDFYNLDFEKLNHLWGVSGGSYLPSVLYKVRLMKMQKDQDKDAPQITSIAMNTGPRH